MRCTDGFNTKGMMIQISLFRFFQLKKGTMLKNVALVTKLQLQIQ